MNLSSPLSFSEALREVAENSDQMIWLRDSDTRQFFYISPAYEKIWGRSVESLYEDPLSWREAVHPEDRETVSAAMAKQENYNITYRVIRPDGAIRWVTARIFAIKDQTGEPTRMAGILADVTEQREIERAFYETEERLRQIAENLDQVIWLQDTAPTLLYINPAYEKVSGRSLATLRSHPDSWRELVHPEDRERVFASARTSPSGEALVFRIVRDDGHIRWISLRTFPIPNAAGEIRRLAGIATDVTQQLEIERALRESERRSRELAENIEEVFWTWTREPMQLLYVSPAYERIWGRDRESLYKSPLSWRETIHPDDREHVVQAITGPAEARVDMEYRIFRPQGEIRWMRERIFPIRGESGSIERWIAVTDDITVQKQAADALKMANRRLQVLSRRRIQVQEEEHKLLAIELHDQLGQTLTATQLALEASKRARRTSDRARQLRQATDLINQMMQQVRRMSFNLRPPVLDDLGLVAALRSLLAESAQQSGWVTQFRAPEKFPTPDDEVATACFRIVLEALANVTRHAKAKKVRMELQATERQFTVSVVDDGMGFNMAESEKRIQRDHLGLVGMNERASAVGGTFCCESAPGGGTQITVSLPFHAA
ncbi:MAG TPA: PAS domain-containing protein [Terriglobales bacterium]|nr:PAS domain-containing protein [Terriglobales bacterium]